MKISVEVAGKAADRFRAYASAKILRKATADDQAKRIAAGKPALGQGARIRFNAEQPALVGDISGEAFTVKAGDVTVTRLVLYKGPVEAEIVVGAVDVNASGDIDVALVEPVAPAPEIVDED